MPAREVLATASRAFALVGGGLRPRWVIGGRLQDAGRAVERHPVGNPVPLIPPEARGQAPLVVPVSVSCTSAMGCMMVSTTENMTFAERWNGSRWTVEPTSNPARRPGPGSAPG